MNIIIAGDYVAGIFADLADATRYIEQRTNVDDGFILINLPYEFPFFLLQLEGGQFEVYQNEEEALHDPEGVILFSISQDFRPEPAWSDQMGSLPHDQLEDDDD